MAYLGNRNATGENNSFKILDDLAFTTTFNGSDGNVVNHSADTITINNHRFLTGSRVTYTNGGGGNITGLTNGTVYFTIKIDHNTIKLATNASNAASGTAINITGTGTGVSHTLSVAFDGVNTKFVATYDSGTKAQMTRAAQLFLSHNGVIQRPHDSTSPANGYGIDANGSVIIFSTAPASTDIIFGNLVANNFPTFDISDNKVDTFTADGSTTTFTLSRAVVNNDNILVALDGVIQYPSDSQNTRSYSVSGTGSNSLTFASAPAQGTVIHVRHIGFAGASTSGVTGFFGRSGNITLIDSDPVVGIESGGVAIGTVRTLNFVGTGNTFKKTGNVIDISIAGGSGGGGAGAFTTSITGIQTSSAIVGVGTTSTDDADLQGIGNSARGLYISNGMIIYDNAINGNHYIGTSMNGLMAGPVSVNGVLNVDGNFVVV
tara:strand:- start:3847 stop:5145 length:1299 start_codon:yes stop_codon:yes gene_type:complete